MLSETIVDSRANLSTKQACTKKEIPYGKVTWLGAERKKKSKNLVNKVNPIYDNKPVTITIPLDDQDTQVLTYDTMANNTAVVDPNSFTYSTTIWDNTVTFNELINTGEVEKMCTEYPALDRAYRNFRQIYDLVKADYKSKNKKA